VPLIDRGYGTNQRWLGGLTNLTRYFCADSADYCPEAVPRYPDGYWFCTQGAHSSAFPHLAGQLSANRVAAVWWTPDDVLEIHDESWRGQLSGVPSRARGNACRAILQDESVACTLPNHCLRYPHVAEGRGPLAIWWDDSLSAARPHAVTQSSIT
jgi:hypothetical protein